MKDHGVSLNKNCTCTQTGCPIRGNCVLCIQNHIVHKRHIPECMQELLREDVEKIAQKLEFKVTEDRPGESYFKDLDKKKFVKESLKRHGKESG